MWCRQWLSFSSSVHNARVHGPRSRLVWTGDRKHGSWTRVSKIPSAFKAREHGLWTQVCASSCFQIVKQQGIFRRLRPVLIWRRSITDRKFGNSILLVNKKIIINWSICDRLRLKPNSITLSGSNQLRTSFEPDSVMKFGFYDSLREGEPYKLILCRLAKRRYNIISPLYKFVILRYIM